MVKHIVFLRNPEEPPAWGGLEKLMLDWFKNIDLNQCKVTLAVYSDWVMTFKNKLSENGLDVQVTALPFEHQQGNMLNRFFKLFLFLRGLKPSSVIFVQGWLFSFNLFDVFAAFLVSPSHVYMHENLGPPAPPVRTSKKYFGLFEGVGLWWYIQIYSAQLRACISKKIIVVSREIKEMLVSLWRYPADKILVMHPGIELDRYRPNQEIRFKMRASLNIAPDETVIVAASRLSKEKCVDRTLKAFDALVKEFPQMTLVIIGTGALTGELTELARSLPSSQKIIFTGYVDNVGDYYKMSDIYVLSSDKEGFGIALIEAMATGLLCVATKCPGPNEIIHDGINGFLTEKSAEGVLNGLQKAIKLSKTQKAQIQQKAMQSVSENFEMKQKIRDVFNALEISCREMYGYSPRAL